MFCGGWHLGFPLSLRAFRGQTNRFPQFQNWSSRFWNGVFQKSRLSVEFAGLGVEQVGEEEGAVFSVGGHVGVKPAPLFGCLAGHKRPTDGLGVGEDSGLDGFLFCGGWHGYASFCSMYVQNVLERNVRSDGGTRARFPIIVTAFATEIETFLFGGLTQAAKNDAAVA